MTPRAASARIARLLEVHPEVDVVDQHLHLSLRLHGPAHDPESHPGLAVLHHESRDDGVERPLAGRVALGWRGSRAKVRRGPER